MANDPTATATANQTALANGTAVDSEGNPIKGFGGNSTPAAPPAPVPFGGAGFDQTKPVSSTNAPTGETYDPTTGTLTYTGGAGTTPAGAGLNPYKSQPDLMASGQASGYLDSSGNIQAAPSETDIQNQTLKQFQSEIDSLNAAAAIQKAQFQALYAPIEANRVGSNVAQQGRGGEIGSNVGSAQTDTINAANAYEMSTGLSNIDTQTQAKIQAIYGQVATQASTDYNAKLAAYTKSADDARNFKTNVAPGLAQKASDDAATAAINAGINVNDPNAVQTWANQVASTYTNQSGIYLDPNAVIKSLTAASQTAQATKAAQDKATIEAQKASQTTLTQGSELVGPDGKIIASGQPKTINAGRYGTLQYNQATGQYEPLTQPIPTLPKGKESTATQAKNQAINGVDTYLSAKAGTDGRVSPQDYLTAKKAWIADGFAATEFDSKFGKYANPADLQDYRTAQPIQNLPQAGQIQNLP